MAQITVNELLSLCKQEVARGNGKKNIVISDDNEGNGYHGLFYGFTECSDEFKDDVYDSRTSGVEDTIILG